jgi:hypothetical protein
MAPWIEARLRFCLGNKDVLPRAEITFTILISKCSSPRGGLTLTWSANASKTANEYWATGASLLKNLSMQGYLKFCATTDCTTNRWPSVDETRGARLWINSENDVVDTLPPIVGTAKSSSNTPVVEVGAS